MSLELKTINCPTQELAAHPCVYINTTQYLAIGSQYIQTAAGQVLNVRPTDLIPVGSIAINMLERLTLHLTLDSINPYTPFTSKMEPIDTIRIGVEVFGIKNPSLQFDIEVATAAFISNYEHMVFRIGQKTAFNHCGILFKLSIIDIAGAEGPAMLTRLSTVAFERAAGASTPFQLKGATAPNQIFNTKSFDFKDLDIGGLNEELTTIFRKVFTSRLLAPTVVEKLNISHIKGLILYGPPGTGKTLIARQLSKSLKSKTIRIVNGPELISSYVGKSEENIRALFKEADEDMRGGVEGLHVIVFDEFDSLCRRRGESSGVSGDVNDKIVTQLLSKIDGVDSLNNILLIGMTNRVELLDSAILRPGRFEVHVEISLPTEEGRKEILSIHTRALRENKCMAADVDIGEIAGAAKNYTGAELEGLVRDARSYAVNELVDLQNLSRQIGVGDICVNQEHFTRALQSYTPKYGATECDIAYYMPNGIKEYCEEFTALNVELQSSLASFWSGSQQLFTIILKGPTGSGKTAFSAWLARSTGIPYIKIISNNDMIGYSEQAKTQYIRDLFEQAYISDNSVIVLDSIETIVEWYRDDVTGALRFMSSLLNAIKTLIRKVPPKPGHKLAIILNYDSMKDLDKFVNVVCTMPLNDGQTVRDICS